jgi:hypothetical protein
MLTERGSLIVPVADEVVDALAPGGLVPALALGRLMLQRKTEHHLTVLNFGIGRLVKKVLDVVPPLRGEIDALARGWPFALRLQDVFYHLAQDLPDRPHLSTVVVMAEADLAGFYARLAARVRALDAPPAAALAEALGAPPPPHVTLYTSDPEGKAGIGLNQVAELEAARARAADPHDDGAPALRAYRLHAQVVRGAPT